MCYVVFVKVEGLPLSSWVERGSGNSTAGMSVLLSKLHGCVNQLEQFPVRVHDLPGRRSVTIHLSLSDVHVCWCVCFQGLTGTQVLQFTSDQVCVGEAPVSCGHQPVEGWGLENRPPGHCPCEPHTHILLLILNLISHRHWRDI